jgi:hypothetical protein
VVQRTLEAYSFAMNGFQRTGWGTILGFCTVLAAFGCGNDTEATSTTGSGGGAANSGGSSSNGSGGNAVATTPEDLKPGWNEFKPGGDTVCSRGTEYAYWVHPGTVNKVVIDFIGGGACWNQLTCSVADAIFNADVDNVRKTIGAGVATGYYDKERAENPFKDWYHVVIPYCTGDIHWGDNVATYGEGDNAVTINHKGAVNTRAVLDWVYSNFSAPEQIMVTGCSAGSYGSIMWSAHIAEHYKDSKVIQFGDSGAGIITKDFFEQSFPTWKADGSFPTWIDDLDPTKVDILGLELSDLYIGLSNHYGQHQFSQYTSAFDDNQIFYFQAMGGGDKNDWAKAMRESIKRIEDKAPKFASFIPSGEQHCILPYDNFYTVNVGGKKLTDWLQEMIDGKTPDDLSCTSDCDAKTP